MKKPLYIIGCCIAMIVFIQPQAKSQESSRQQTATKEVEYEDDLSANPYGKKPEEKKTLAQKIKERIGKQEEPETPKPEKERPEEYIRFYEFEDITFADRQSADEQTREDDGYKVVKEDDQSTKEYYKDVTFSEEGSTDEKEPAFDNQPYAPYQDYSTFDSAETEQFTTKGSTPTDKPEIEKQPAKKLPPIRIRGKDFYRQDYRSYYEDRKKKGNGNPSNPVDFSDEISKSKKRILERMNENDN